MPDVTLFGFPRSVYVQMAGIVLTHKEVPYTFHDLETEMTRVELDRGFDVVDEVAHVHRFAHVDNSKRCGSAAVD